MKEVERIGEWENKKSIGSVTFAIGRYIMNKT